MYAAWSPSQNAANERLAEGLTNGTPLRVYAAVSGLDGAGGDLVDARTSRGIALGLTLADVSGHGSEAFPRALRVRRVLADLDERARNRTVWLRNLNDRLYGELGDEHFCATTSARLQWSPDGRRVAASLVIAGTPKPVLYEAAAGRARCVGAYALPFGVERDDRLLPQPTRLPLAIGDLAVLFSDGLTEATDPRGRMFGAERVRRIVELLGRFGGRAVLDGLAAAARRFTGAARPSDDRSIVVIEVAGFSRQLGHAAA